MLANASRVLARSSALSLSRRTLNPQASWALSSSSRFFHASSPLFDELPYHIVQGMPALSPTMEQGNLTEWYLAEGDSFIAGDAVAKIETDKASVDFEAQDDGCLAKILVPAGTEDVAVGTPIMVTVEEQADVAAFADYQLPEAEASKASPPSTTESPAESAPSSPEVTSMEAAPTSSENLHPLLPSARFLSESKGLDATGLKGTGKDGRITKGDVLLAIQNGVQMPPLKKKIVSESAAPTVASTSEKAAATATPPAASASSGPMADIANLEIDTEWAFEDVKNNNMRKVIAKRLTESKGGVPHFYTSMEVELDNVLALRKELVKNHEIKVSVNDLIIRCSSLALRDVPEVNGTFDPKSNSVRLQETIDVSVAVATPTGLITPIVPNTDKLGLSEITNAIRDLAGRARDGKLQPHEYQGGTFCVSNLGMFGIDEFSAVINPPQAAILAVGGGTRRVVPTPYIDGAEVQPKPSIKTIMTARLSADRRVVDEATASLFMSSFKKYINNPELLLL